jgi:hypothetical protein
MSNKEDPPQRSSAVDPAEVEVGYRHRDKLKSGAKPKGDDADDNGAEESLYVGMGLMRRDTTDDAWRSSVWQKNREHSRNAATRVRLDRTGEDTIPTLRDKYQDQNYYFLTEEEDISDGIYITVVLAVFGITLGIAATLVWLG